MQQQIRSCRTDREFLHMCQLIELAFNFFFLRHGKGELLLVTTVIRFTLNRQRCGNYVNTIEVTEVSLTLQCGCF